jgi:hypothetical protein
LWMRNAIIRRRFEGEDLVLDRLLVAEPHRRRCSASESARRRADRCRPVPRRPPCIRPRSTRRATHPKSAPGTSLRGRTTARREPSGPAPRRRHDQQRCCKQTTYHRFPPPRLRRDLTGSRSRESPRSGTPAAHRDERFGGGERRVGMSSLNGLPTPFNPAL